MIELLVATTLFVTVIGIASGLFIQSLRSQKATVALMAANDNASLALEQISREIRIGSDFTVSSDGTELIFNSERSGAITYRFNATDNTIERNDVALTSNNVKVSYLYFDLMGEELNDGQSTRVTIRLGVSAKEERIKEIITRLQTTVSSRQLDT